MAKVDAQTQPRRCRYILDFSLHSLLSALSTGDLDYDRDGDSDGHLDGDLDGDLDSQFNCDFGPD